VAVVAERLVLARSTSAERDAVLFRYHYSTWSKDPHPAPDVKRSVRSHLEGSGFFGRFYELALPLPLVTEGPRRTCPDRRRDLIWIGAFDVHPWTRLNVEYLGQRTQTVGHMDASTRIPDDSEVVAFVFTGGPGYARRTGISRILNIVGHGDLPVDRSLVFL
jgi:hypothetical protein